ncbi:NUDIX domain-containing protein [Thermogemmatispora carboxidivorans]|uniref:NUDIX domain-containing protein n=1 Tax=Thermogemmatispora carboxidivorans TaxID=1382306 RepID=UPI00138E063F|nr:NUDIX domain-containing protein [Thermogemmatispora carboxidivorans]
MNAMKTALYTCLKRCVSFCFNLLNRLLGGKLPPFGSAAVVVEEQGRYLVLLLPSERAVFPGGFMTWREHPREAAEREGREETGLVLEADDLINFYSLATTDWRSMSTVSFVYHASVRGGLLRPGMEGRPCWLTEEELRQRMDCHSLRILDDYLSYRQRRRAELSRVKTLVPLMH